MTFAVRNRRQLLSGLGAIGIGLAFPAFSQTRPLVRVVKDPDCGCCSAWIEIMGREGFEMDVRDASYEDLQAFKTVSGIGSEMASCHTAIVEGYTIEGHVPPSDVRRLLRQRPDAIGLSVPGMPYGSPGMGPESKRDEYSVYLIRKGGRHSVFQHYEARP